MKRPETLLETVPYMIDDRFELRLIGEYFQTKIRLEKLQEYHGRKVYVFRDEIIPQIMKRQIHYMDMYLTALKEIILHLGIDRIIEGGL